MADKKFWGESLKNFIWIVVILLILGTGFVVKFQINSPEKAAKVAESKADYVTAIDKYADIILAMSDGTQIPKKSKAQILEPKDWAEKVENFLSWVLYPPEKIKAALAEALDGIARCSSYVENENFEQIFLFLARVDFS